MTSIGIVGLGNWGSALAHHLSLRGHEVVAWARDPQVVSEINSRHLNPKYLKGVRLSPQLKASTDLVAVSAREVVVLAFPSACLGTIVPKLGLSKHSSVISAIKGFERETLAPTTQFLERAGVSFGCTAVLSGPSFARDIAEGRPCGVVLASRQNSDASRLAQLFASDAMRLFTSTDVVGVELGGAIKNVIALAAGACDGLGLGESARAGLITRGLAEMMRLAEVLGAESKTLAGLAGLGDLIMTSTSGMSRNHQVGFRLGRGERLPDILSTLGSVAEGVETTKSVQKLARLHNVRVTITDAVAMVLDGKASPREMISSLVVQPVKPEFD